VLRASFASRACLRESGRIRWKLSFAAIWTELFVRNGLAVTRFVATAPFDMSLTAAIWNPPLARGVREACDRHRAAWRGESLDLVVCRQGGLRRGGRSRVSRAPES
jgi:hypothetical protein